MKAKIIKRMLTGILAASLVMAPTMSVGAASSTANTTSGASEAVAAVVEAPATSAVAGVRSTVTGVYLAQSVEGCAVTTAAASIAQSYGLGSNEKAFTKFSDLDVKKSPLAKKAIDLAAASQGAVVGPMLNIELGKMSGGKYSLLPSDGAAIRLSFGIPKAFAQADKTFAVVCVRAGGAVSILTDVDSNPNTITFDTTGGAGAYAIIKY